jgi:hypothetical protein
MRTLCVGIEDTFRRAEQQFSGALRQQQRAPSQASATGHRDTAEADRHRRPRAQRSTRLGHVRCESHSAERSRGESATESQALRRQQPACKAVAQEGQGRSTQTRSLRQKNHGHTATRTAHAGRASDACQRRRNLNSSRQIQRIGFCVAGADVDIENGRNWDD